MGTAPTLRAHTVCAVTIPAASTAEGLLPLALALGIGLLLGVERERRKGEGAARAPAGIRTFALVALLGGLAERVGSAAVIAVAGAFVAVAVVVAFVQSEREDPGRSTTGCCSLPRR